MRKSSGLMLLLLAGAGSATLYAKPQELSDLIGRVSSLSSAGAQQLPAGSLPPMDGTSLTKVQQPRVFSPSTPLIETTETSGNKAIRLAQAPIRPLEVQGRPGNFGAPLAAEGSRRLASSKPGDDDARRELTRDLQKELKRVGCFDGEVNGTWSSTSKKAMSAFMDRVNATLPVEEPDYILLTLVQGHAALACGKGCPSGQGLSNDGRCQPQSILAQTARKTDDRKGVDRLDKPKTTDTKVADAKPVDVKPPVDPNSIQTGSLAKKSASSSWTTATVAVVEQTKPDAAKPQVPMAQIILPPAPLPGRMAMGAPVPSPDDATKLDELEARKRRAQAALIDEQKLQAKAQLEADRLKAERLNAEALRRDQQIRAQALAEAEREKDERANADKNAEKTLEDDRRERQVAAADARRTAQRQADALEAGTKPETAPEAVTSSAVTSDAASAAAVAAAERRTGVRRTKEARERDEERAERERRTAAATPPPVVKRPPPPAPRYVSVARAAPPPTPRPKPDQRWTRTFFSDLSRNGR